MKLICREKLISWLGGYDIYDEQGRTVYTIKGQISVGRHLTVYQNGEEVARLKEKIIALLPRYDLYINNKFSGYIRKEVTLFHPRFNISNGYKLRGNFFEWNYVIEDKTGHNVAKISKDVMNITDTYTIDIKQEKDCLLTVLVCLAIDIERSQREASKMKPEYKRYNKK